MPPLCSSCNLVRPAILRPKNRDRLCAPCFITTFENEVHDTITKHSLFPPRSRIAIGASGGKDSTVLASVLHTINVRYNYNWELVLLSIDEGIKGYRDDSLGAVEWLGRELGLRWKVLGYKDLYGWTMDQVVEQIGKKGNCTYCGVWRRQALDRGVGFLDEGVEDGGRKGGWRLCTGHNADDVAETVVMNLLRGDTPRLSRCTHITTSTPTAPGSAPAHSFVSRSKPLIYAYEKEIVLYAHHRKLTYFSTECIYSPEAFRGSARALIKDLERVRPEAILDLGRAGAILGACVPGAEAGKEVGEVVGGCGKGGIIGGVEERQESLPAEENTGHNTLETEVTLASVAAMSLDSKPDEKSSDNQVVPLKSRGRQKKQQPPPSKKSLLPGQQTMGKCARCGYLTSQDVCKACVLLEGLNKNRPKIGISVSDDVKLEAANEVGRRKLAGETLLEIT